MTTSQETGMAFKVHHILIISMHEAYIAEKLKRSLNWNAWIIMQLSRKEGLFQFIILSMLWVSLINLEETCFRKKITKGMLKRKFKPTDTKHAKNQGSFSLGFLKNWREHLLEKIWKIPKAWMTPVECSRPCWFPVEVREGKKNSKWHPLLL